jgi:hypothetical protein
MFFLVLEKLGGKRDAGAAVDSDDASGASGTAAEPSQAPEGKPENE